jgi:asparagine synthase (glutamine-hydrolysing)
MCRVAGIWTRRDGQDLAAVCTTMRDAMSAGGPDDAGLFMDANSGIALGHRRLSVIDLTETGRQPMTDASGRFTICYNGEAYNYRELRAELEELGFKFRGTSDTEVVLNAFAAWGVKSVERLIGMFAFALWDGLERRLYLVRDRIGVKPLYYYHEDGVFAFVSELKALHAGLKKRLSVDRETLAEFFHYGYISGDRSIYRHVRKLEPGCILSFAQGADPVIERYWDPAYHMGATACYPDEDTAASRLEELLTDAFLKRLVADVPVGVFLSGGIDSSLVTAILAHRAGTPIRTFTIGFAERSYDESAWARAIARHLGTDHYEETVTSEHARAVLPLWPRIYDEPFGDISGIPTTIVSRMTRAHVKVSLSADGGDELFCGYHRYWVMAMLERIFGRLPRAIPNCLGRLMGLAGTDFAAALAGIYPGLRLPALRDRMRKFQAVLTHWDGTALAAYPYAVAYWLPLETDVLVGGYTDPRDLPDDTPEGIVKAMMLWDIKHYLPEDILTKVDRATMSVGLEGRDPFLDHRVAEFALGLPLEFTYRRGSMKHILKKILSRHLPEKLFDRPKQGFAVPVYTWLHDDLLHLVDEYLNPDAMRSQTEIDPGPILDTVGLFKAGKGSMAVDRVWLALVYMMWRRMYLG